MVGTRTRPQALVLTNGNEQASSEIVDKNKTKKIPFVKLKRYKVLARRFEIKLNGSFEMQLQGIIKKVTGPGVRRNTRDRAKGINNLVINKNFVLVSENQIELQKQVKLNFASSSIFTIRNIGDNNDKSEKMDTNNNAIVGNKNKSVDNGQATSCRDAADPDYTPRKVPKWSSEPQLSRSLRSQQEISPDTIFAEQASIRPEDLAHMFPQTSQERDIWNSPPRPINHVTSSEL